MNIRITCISHILESLDFSTSMLSYDNITMLHNIVSCVLIGRFDIAFQLDTFNKTIAQNKKSVKSFATP